MLLARHVASSLWTQFVMGGLSWYLCTIFVFYLMQKISHTRPIATGAWKGSAPWSGSHLFVNYLPPPHRERVGGLLQCVILLPALLLSEKEAQSAKRCDCRRNSFSRLQLLMNSEKAFSSVKWAPLKTRGAFCSFDSFLVGSLLYLSFQSPSGEWRANWQPLLNLPCQDRVSWTSISILTMPARHPFLIREEKPELEGIFPPSSHFCLLAWIVPWQMLKLHYI